MQVDRRSLAGRRVFFAGLGCWAALAAAVALVSVAGFPAIAVGQEKKPAAKADKTPTIPEPEDLELQTEDGLLLSLTYYAGVNRDGIELGKGKRVIPIVLLHGWKQSRKDFAELAKSLQKSGHAVIVPDLRGHGDSIRGKGDSRNASLDATKMAPAQFSMMVTKDMAAVKDFLWAKNNAAELNIDKLCVVGSEMGASVAVGFAAFDAIGYGSGAVYYGPRKLGRFVKGLVLISPKWALPGLPLGRAMKDPVVQADIAVLILVGKQDAKALTEAKRIYGMFDRWHPVPADDDKLEQRTLFLGQLDTNLQGTRLLEPGFNVPILISDFVAARLIKSDAAREWTWKERKGPND